MFGITQFTAVINPPQSCILAVGGTQIVLDDQSQPCSYITLTLSSDLRVVDEVVAADFLSTVKSYLELPEKLLV